jgi:hypothetical protein
MKNSSCMLTDVSKKTSTYLFSQSIMNRERNENTILQKTYDNSWNVSHKMEVLKIMDAVNQDELKWFFDNFDTLLKKYPNKWIAIQNNVILASGNDYCKVYKKVKEKGYNSPFIVEVNTESWDTSCVH